MTVTSCFVYKVVRDLEFNLELIILYPQYRIYTQVISRFALAQVEYTR